MRKHIKDLSLGELNAMAGEKLAISRELAWAFISTTVPERHREQVTNHCITLSKQIEAKRNDKTNSTG